MNIPYKQTVNVIHGRNFMRDPVREQREVFVSLKPDGYGGTRELIHTGKKSIYPGVIRGGHYVLRLSDFE